jgi:hypothetical protein
MDTCLLVKKVMKKWKKVKKDRMNVLILFFLFFLSSCVNSEIKTEFDLNFLKEINLSFQMNKNIFVRSTDDEGGKVIFISDLIKVPATGPLIVKIDFKGKIVYYRYNLCSCKNYYSSTDIEKAIQIMHNSNVVGVKIDSCSNILVSVSDPEKIDFVNIKSENCLQFDINITQGHYWQKVKK